MISEFRTEATVQPGGLVQIRCDHLPEGATVKVIILVETSAPTQKTPLEMFEELGLVGCIEESDPDLSTNYKPLIHQYLQEKYETTAFPCPPSAPSPPS